MAVTASFFNPELDPGTRVYADRIGPRTFYETQSQCASKCIALLAQPYDGTGQNAGGRCIAYAYRSQNQACDLFQTPYHIADLGTQFAYQRQFVNANVRNECRPMTTTKLTTSTTNIESLCNGLVTPGQTTDGPTCAANDMCSWNPTDYTCVTKGTGCLDLRPGWVDADGDSCTDYHDKLYCNSDGSNGPRWDPSQSFEFYTIDGTHAGEVCCACGGGVQDCSGFGVARDCNSRPGCKWQWKGAKSYCKPVHVPSTTT